MVTYNPPLEKIKIAASCKAEWRWMYGNDRVRFCGQCNLNVYNLSAMTREEAEDLIRRTEGRLCVKFYRRSDGTILTRNCPVGLQAIKDRLTNARSHFIAALMSLLAYCGIFVWHRGVMNGIEDYLYQKQAYSRKIESIGFVACPASPWMAPTVEMGNSLMVQKVQVRESFMRDRAIYKVIPIHYSGTSPFVVGDAVVKVIIDEDGMVDVAKLIKGNQALKYVAEGAAIRWKFQPVIIKGRPVRVESTLTFHFAR